MSNPIKHEAPPPDEKDPWGDDKLERKKDAEFLTPILLGVHQPFVIGLYSGYGTGKTHFIRRWMCHLKGQYDLESIYFNAWETDFSQEPLFAFMDVINEEFLRLSGPNKKRVATVAEWTKAALRHVAPIAVKATAKHLIGDEAIKEIADFTNTNATEALGKWAEAGLSAQAGARTGMSKFRSELEKIVQKLIGKNQGGTSRKIVVFIDDLDRCRPTYAVQILETIKHFFSVQGLVFVLAVDDEQLSSVLKVVYGHDINADGYLRRMIDWRFRLPKPSAIQYVDYLADKYLEPEADITNRFIFFADFAQAFGFSLRQQEQALNEIFLARHSSKDGLDTLTLMAIEMVVATRMKWPDYFPPHDKSIHAKDGMLHQAGELLGKQNLTYLGTKHIGSFLLDYIFKPYRPGESGNAINAKRHQILSNEIPCPNRTIPLEIIEKIHAELTVHPHRHNQVNDSPPSIHALKRLGQASAYL
ncbi:MAG: hypothetical protein HQL44_11920 [Alphaproteobacteria bacterium]|nr:hypothetical protein [Alphaproteobacteria bacterium]